MSDCKNSGERLEMSQIISHYTLCLFPFSTPIVNSLYSLVRGLVVNNNHSPLLVSVTPIVLWGDGLGFIGMGMALLEWVWLYWKGLAMYFREFFPYPFQSTGIIIVCKGGGTFNIYLLGDIFV